MVEAAPLYCEIERERDAAIKGCCCCSTAAELWIEDNVRMGKEGYGSTASTHWQTLAHCACHRATESGTDWGGSASDFTH